MNIKKTVTPIISHSSTHHFELTRRPRRLRTSSAVRQMICETTLQSSDLIAPLFVRDGKSRSEPIKSMPGCYRYNMNDLVKQCEKLVQLGVPAVALFPCIDSSLKDPEGSLALDSSNLTNRAIRAVKKAFPKLIVITDVALDPYTSHGHDGVLDSKGRDVDNDATVKILAQMAIVQAESGSDWVAPSDMMDGRVGAIRQELDHNGLQNTVILAYSAKFASAYYGPFRDAIGSKRPKKAGYLDKRTYQMNPANVREAIMEALLDEEEGADILMVKPAGPYLDVIARLREQTLLPIAAYQVSGEYAQIHASARLGWLDLVRTRDESLLAIKRAGADMILTYFAEAIAKDLKAVE